MSNGTGTDAKFQDAMYRSSPHAVRNGCNGPRPRRWNYFLGQELSCELLCVAKASFAGLVQGMDQLNDTVRTVRVDYGINQVEHWQIIMFDPLSEPSPINWSRQIPLFSGSNFIGLGIDRIGHGRRLFSGIAAINY